MLAAVVVIAYDRFSDGPVGEPTAPIPHFQLAHAADVGACLRPQATATRPSAHHLSLVFAVPAGDTDITFFDGFRSAFAMYAHRMSTGVLTEADDAINNTIVDVERPPSNAQRRLLARCLLRPVS